MSFEPDRMDARDKTLVAAAWLVLAAGAAWVLGPLLGGYFLADDFVPLVLFRRWEDEGQLASQLIARFHGTIDQGANHFYRPLSYATFAFNYATSGIEAGPWHATNVAAHVASGVMAGLVGVQLAGARGVRAGFAAAVGAALFIFFAPGEEVVGWISGRFDATATFFTMGSCLLFLRSTRHGDAASVASLACAFAAFLCKESAASLPFAILMISLVIERPQLSLLDPRRWIAAAWRASPWLVVAALYLAARYVFFGSFTRVYAESAPLAAVMTSAYWTQLADSIPPWLYTRFPAPGHLLVLLALAALQVLLVAWALVGRRNANGSRDLHHSRDGHRARDAILVLAAVVAVTLLLVAPHIGKLPANGVGGRLFYQTAAFYAALGAAALAVARPAWPLGLVSLALVLVNAASLSEALARHDAAYAQMRALVSEVQREAREVPPGGYTLALVPGYYDSVIFAMNAQGGLLMPPVMAEPITPRLLVRLHEEMVHLDVAIDEGVITQLKRYPLFEIMDGKHPGELPREFPTRVTCWNAAERRLVALDVTPGESSKAWVAAIRSAMPAAGCGAPPG